MSYSFADDLKRLSVPVTVQLSHSDKFRASFLYDPKEAANLERHTVYCLGLSGLEELIAIDDDFKQYEENLFAESSESLQRSVQTTEVNKKLNKVISDFLFQLSPYILLRSAHKALEWLVHRFYIHLYNDDDLIRCVLPFHATNVFVRAVQMLSFRGQKSKWEWLLNVKKSGVPLAKTAIVNYAERNFDFLKFICDTIEFVMKENDEEKAKKYQVVITFYSSTIMSVIQQCKKFRRHEMLTIILPSILNGLNSTILDIQCSSLTFISQLAVKNVMKPKLFETLVKKVVKMNKHDISIEAVRCLIVLYQTQKYEKIPQKCLISLERMNDFVDILCDLDKDFYLAPFIHPILLGCIVLMDDKTLKIKNASKLKEQKRVKKSNFFFKLFKNIVNKLQLDGEVVRGIISQLIDVHLDNAIGRTTTAKMFCQFETKYPDIFDEVLEKFLERASESERNVIQKVLIASSNVGKQKHSTKIYGTSLYLNLNHPKQGRRKAALDKLLQRIRDHKEKNVQFVSEALQASLLDDFYQIPIAIFREFNEIYHFIPTTSLFEAMKIILDKHKLTIKGSEYLELMQLVLDAMCSKEFVSNMSNDELDKVFVYLIAYIFPTNVQTLTLSGRLIQSHLCKTHKLLIGISDLNTDNLATFFEELIGFIGRKLMELDSETRIRFVTLLIDQCTIRSKSIFQLRFVITSLLKYLIPLSLKDEAIKFSSLLTDLSNQCLKQKRMLQNESSEDQNSNTESYLKTINDNRLPSPHIIDCLNVVIKNIKIPKSLKENYWWLTVKDETPLLNLLIDIFNLLTKQTISEDNLNQQKLFRNLLKDFMNLEYKNPQLFIRFMGMLWTAHSQPTSESILQISLEIQAISLAIAKNFFSTEELDFLNDNDDPTIVMLLIALAQAPNSLCGLILDCFEELNKRDKVKYKSLISRIIKNKSELKMDLEQLPFILSKVCKHHETICDLLFGFIESKSVPDYVKGSLLESLRYTNSSKSLNSMCDLAKITINNDTVTESQGKIIEEILNRFSPEAIESAQDQEKIIEIIKLSLNSKLDFNHTKTSCRFVTLNLITKHLLNSFTESKQQILFDAIVDLKVTNENPELTDSINRILKKIVSESMHIISLLRNLLNMVQKTPLSLRSVKRRRVESILEEKSKESKNETEKWQHVCCVLETLQKKKKIANLPDLIPLLFELLNRCLELEDQTQVEQRKQLILTCIHHCCSKLETGSIDKRHVNIDLVVKCLRASKDKQTHNDALLLLTLMANMFPESVLHNVMAIFTFMGTNVLRQDDYYSFEIMARTTKAVVPAMLSANKTTGGRNKPVFLVLRIFVDAFPDMPIHRRRAIFSQLLDSLNPELFLGSTLGLLLELSVTYKQQNTAEDKTRTKDVTNAAFKFALALAASYSPFIQIKSCVELLQFLAALPIDKDDKIKKQVRKPSKAHDTIFNLEAHSARDLRHFQYNCIIFVSSVIGSQIFIEQVSELRECQPTEYEDSCKILLEQILHFSNRVALTIESNSANQSVKFSKTLLHRTYEVLDKVNALLPGSVFVAVISSLMDSNLSIVRRKAMELLNSRLQFHPDVLQENEVTSLTVLIDPLLRQVDIDDDSDSARSNQQVALLSLKMLCRLLGSQQNEQLVQVLDVVIRAFLLNADHDVICASALLCVVEVCACLGAYAISSLHKFMPTVLSIFSMHSRLLSQELLLLSMISSILRLMETLSHFLSPFLPDLIKQICIISTNEICDQKSSINNKLLTLRNKIAISVPTRVLLPAITNCYEDLVLKSEQSLSILMLLLAECIVAMDKDTRASNLSTLQSFFLNTLDYRSLHPEDDVTNLENYIFEPVLALVMKLSESNFRPFFYKIFNWASQTEAPKERSITFYHLTDKIVDKLKSLFLLFAGHFVQNAAILLNENNSCKGDLMFENENESCTLVEFILQTLYKCFLYDKDGFVNKERFDTLMNPLVDQIENQIGEDLYDERISKLLAPCLGQLAEATADEANWKTLNYQILLKTRHNLPNVRLGALQCIDELNRHLEKDYLSLLPETIPFLAELLEDESIEVEQKCRTVVAAMETTLGESLQKYF